MPKFMHHNRTEFLMMGHREVIEIQNASSTIFVGVDKYNDMFVRSAGQPIMHILEVERGEIPIAVKSVEM